MEENRNEEYTENETKNAKKMHVRRPIDKRTLIIAISAGVAVLVAAVVLILLLTGGKECRHSPARAVIENVVESTEDAHGSYDEVVYCRLCDAELSREHKSMNKLAPTIVPEAILMGKSVIDLEIGETYRVTPTVLPVHVKDKSLTFTTDRPDVATVAPDGTVTACGVGRAEITATASNGIQASCFVQVICSPTSHVPDAPVETNHIYATCSDYAQYDIVVCCIHCGLDLSCETVYGTELGDHYFEDGECLYCGETEEN